MATAVLGIIGGSGVYDLPELQDVRELAIETPWGLSSDPLREGMVGETRVVFLSRHGKGHRFSPSDINYRANIAALKMAGVTDLVSISACGSFREDLPPGTLILVDQFIDRTYRRESSFFGAGCVAHVSMAQPVGPALQDMILQAAGRADLSVKRGGTYVCMEGPQFSSLAESRYYKAMGCDVIGMTAMPEAKLAREAEITYATIAMVTDFDCWHSDHDHVSVSDVIRVMSENVIRVGKILRELAMYFPQQRVPCPAGADRALDHAIMTAPLSRDQKYVQKLKVIASRVL